MKYPIIEIFDSFQGEGRFTGVPATFVRFAGCNLSCPWCDTSEQLHSGKCLEMSAEEIVDKIDRNFVVFTGGEPTLYDLNPILDLLEAKKKTCYTAIETNGTGEVNSRIDFVACSPKPESNYSVDDSILKREYGGRPVDYKYVVDDKIMLSNIHLFSKGANLKCILYLQPEYYSFSKSVEKAQELANMLTPMMDVRLGIQAHKYWEVR